jgi:cytoskeletal protein CcmA (bactofilin family)
MYTDGALSRTEAAAVDTHLAGCPTCRQRVSAFRAERQAIHGALMSAETPGPIPALLTPPTIPLLLVWLGWVALAGWGVSLAWSSVTAAGMPAWLDWLAPDVLGAGIQMLVGGLLHLLMGGDGPLTGLLESLGGPLLVGTLVAGGWLLARRHPGPAAPTCLTLCLAAGLLAVAPAGQAFELRRDDVRVTVGPDEIIDDTLIVMAESVLVEGTVTGDLIAMGERVSIRGEVRGIVLGMGNTVELEGTVGGSVAAMGETVTFRNARLGGNAYGMGRVVDLGSATTVAGNTSLMGAEAHLTGRVGRDVLAMGRSVDVRGTVDGNLRSYSERMDVGGSARIGGDLITTVGNADQVTVDPGATVQGETRIDVHPQKPSRYVTWQYYLGEALQLLAAFICGLVLFHLFPGLARGRLDSGGEALTTTAIGALGLVAVPALAVACILTLIGAPLGIAALLMWLLGLYLAGIVTAAFVGRRLLDGADGRPVLSLLLGLGIVYVLVNVPYLGGLARVVVLLLGLGLIGQWLRGLWGSRAVA